VLGQSVNRGWTANVAGGGGLGPPVLTDGYANGWRVDPATLTSAIHNGTMQVVLDWKPQREVDLALVISGVTIVICLFLAFVPRRWRRRRRQRVHALHEARFETDAHPDDAPVLAVPFRGEAPRAPWWVALLGGLVVGTIGTAIAAPAAGLAAGLATVLVLLVPRLRLLLGMAAIAAVVAAGVWAAVHQSQAHVPADGHWPMDFQTAGRWAWAAVVFLGAEGVVDVVLRRRAARRRETDPGEGA
jgi:arabinofuranan 3-O-arabinosyltransferase